MNKRKGKQEISSCDKLAIILNRIDVFNGLIEQIAVANPQN